MLVIRNEQLDSFIAADDTQLVRVISEIIREASYERVENYEDGKLEAMVRIGIERAKSRNFERPEDIAAFVALMFEISPNFDINEQIDALLKDEKLPPSVRIEQMLGRIQEESWREAEDTYDAKAWFPGEQQVQDTTQE